MNAVQELELLMLCGSMRGLEPMTGDEYKRHLLNWTSYSHAFLAGAGVELASADPTALCEAAMHAAACAWCLADYHNEQTPPEPIPAEGWEGLANRMIRSVEKWSKQLKANQAAAYRAPIRERAALKEFPPASGRTPDDASSPAARSGGSVPTPGAGTSKASGARSSGPITDSGATTADDRAAREAFYAPPVTKRSHKKKPATAGS